MFALTQHCVKGVVLPLFNSLMGMIFLCVKIGFDVFHC